MKANQFYYESSSGTIIKSNELAILWHQLANKHKSVIKKVIQKIAIKLQIWISNYCKNNEPLLGFYVCIDIQRKCW